MKPTPKQLAYLRTLAERTGTTFAHPTSKAAASSEITRLKTLPAASRSDVARERRDIQRDLATRPDDTTAIRPHDVRGYGSDAHWAHRPDDAA